MAWIPRSKKTWINQDSTPRKQEEDGGMDLLNQLLPDSLKDNGSFNAWEVATTVGVSKRTVEDWIQGGKLRVVRLPGKVRIPKSSLAAFINKYNS